MRKLDEAERKRRRALRYQKWKSKNSEHLKQYQAEHYLANQERKKAARRKYVAENKEKCKTADKKWYQKNVAKILPQTRARYFKNVDKNREIARRKASLVRPFLATYKLERGCIDCGYRANACALEFDHVRGVKVKEVSSFTSIEAALKEIEKCEVRCANCHRIITANRRDKNK